VADGERHQLDPSYLQAQRMARWIFTAIAGVVLAIQSLMVQLSTDWGLGASAAWVAVVALLAWWSQVWPAIAYRHASYVVGPEGIEITRGVLFRTVINVPRSRVQHTDVSQGPIERQFGLGRLGIYTAGTDHARVQQAGLPHARALRIRDHLLPQGTEDAV
jgi:membrane protein YdbS with pleckstrin-like domain